MVNIAIEEFQELVARNERVADSTAQNDQPQGDGARLVPSVARAVNPARVTKADFRKRNPEHCLTEHRPNRILTLTTSTLKELKYSLWR